MTYMVTIRFERIVAVLFVVFVGVLFALLVPHGVRKGTQAVVTKGVAAKWDQVALRARVLTLPPLRVWMAENGEYSTRAVAMQAVVTNAECGVASFITAQAPYQVMLAPLLNQKQAGVEESRWSRLEVPYFLTEWSLAQTVVPTVSSWSGAQAKQAESQLLQDVVTLQALLGQRGEGAVAAFANPAIMISADRNPRTAQLDAAINRLTRAIEQAQTLASGTSTTALDAALTEAVVDYDGLRQLA